MQSNVRDWTDTRLDAFVDEGNAAREAAAMLRAAVEAAEARDADLEAEPTAWGRACLRAAAWITPLRFWSIYLATLAAVVALALWLRS